MEKNGEGSKILSCSSVTRRDYLERWKERKHTKERCQKWKILFSFSEVFGRERDRERGKNPEDN